MHENKSDADWDDALCLRWVTHLKLSVCFGITMKRDPQSRNPWCVVFAIHLI
jgi:hypothetical protein